MNIGFVGLGMMGAAMAANLAKGGHRVVAWNRSPVKPEDDPGVTIGTLDDVLRSEIVFTMLSDDAAIRSVLLDSGALDSVKHDLIHVVTSTISVGFSQELTADHARRGIRYVAAPVFGRPDAAAAAQLNVVVAGANEAVERVRPLLELL